nr:MAG TPA: hypothetical protein [Caudoviricetes sp.]
MSNHFSHLNHLSGWVAAPIRFVHHGYKYRDTFFRVQYPVANFLVKIL